MKKITQMRTWKMKQTYYEIYNWEEKMRRTITQWHQLLLEYFRDNKIDEFDN